MAIRRLRADPKPRQQRAVRNDERVHDASVQVLVEGGWGALSAKGVALAANVSEQLVRDRGKDALALGASLWSSRLDAEVRGALAGVLASYGLLENPDAAAHLAPSDAFGPLVEPPASLLAAIELLLVAAFEPGLRAVVDSGLGASVRAWTAPGAQRAHAPRAAQRGYVLARALGLLAFARFGGVTKADFAPVADAFGELLASPGAPHPLPRVRARHLDALFPFESSSPELDALLMACGEVVGERGYDRATLALMVERAGVDHNFVYRHYPRKLELFRDAAGRQRLPSARANQAFRARQAERHGPAAAEALLARELMRPGRDTFRILDAEQLRLAWRDAAMRELVMGETEVLVGETAAANPGVPPQVVRAAVIAGRATGFGFQLLASLAPAAWQLPFRVVTTPIYGG